MAPCESGPVVSRDAAASKFAGVRERTGRGEAAIMHATANGTPTTDVPLPDGWTLTEETLPEPLVVRPFGGGDACYFNILRDAKVQSYHQFRYAGPSYP